jgi:hypothetical protein
MCWLSGLLGMVREGPCGATTLGPLLGAGSTDLEDLSRVWLWLGEGLVFPQVAL